MSVLLCGCCAKLIRRAFTKTKNVTFCHENVFFLVLYFPFRYGLAFRDVIPVFRFIFNIDYIFTAGCNWTEHDRPGSKQQLRLERDKWQRELWRLVPARETTKDVNGSNHKIIGSENTDVDYSVVFFLSHSLNLCLSSDNYNTNNK